MNSSSSASVTSWRVRGLQDLPQQLAQAHDQLLGEFRIRVHQLGHRVQRIEEKVRIELAAQRLELRLVQHGFQLHRLHLPVARLAVVSRGMPGEHDPRVHRQIDARDSRTTRASHSADNNAARVSQSPTHRCSHDCSHPISIGDERLREHARSRRRAAGPARASSSRIRRRRRHHQNTAGASTHHESQYTASAAKARGHGVT